MKPQQRAADAAWVVDARSLRIVEANAAAAALIGMAANELVGCGVTSLASTPEELAFWADAYAGLDEWLHSDSWLRRADGSVLAVTRRIDAQQRQGRRVFVVTMRRR